MQKEIQLADGDNFIQWNIINLAAGFYYVEAAGTDMRIKVVKE